MNKDLLIERIVTLTNKTDAAHSRLDRLEKETAKQLEGISKDLKDITGWMNRGKGWAAASLLLAGLAGSAITKLIFK